MSARETILGVPVDNLSMRETLDRVAQFISSGGTHQHVAVNADKVVKARRDPALLRIIAECDLISADGMPVVWASRLLGCPLKERVTGIDLFYRLLELSEARGWRTYFLGARPQVLARCVEWVRAQHPRLHIAGWRDGYWRADEEEAVAEQIARARPQLLFVAISSPRKEQFLSRHRSRMRIPFAMGVGGTFDVVAGVTRRAPPGCNASVWSGFTASSRSRGACSGATSSRTWRSSACLPSI
jgi:N-acetylglucosaminyldiphosphoundecaprenol N-acetyl-beta-D-mannosaminyltransferase